MKIKAKRKPHKLPKPISRENLPMNDLLNAWNRINDILQSLSQSAKQACDDHMTENLLMMVYGNLKNLHLEPDEDVKLRRSVNLRAEIRQALDKFVNEPLPKRLVRYATASDGTRYVSEEYTAASKRWIPVEHHSSTPPAAKQRRHLPDNVVQLSHRKEQ